MPTQPAEFALADERATARLGEAFARAIEGESSAIERQGLVVGLTGDLGAGKTSVVRALLRALGITGAVRSPTFTLVEPYVVSSLNFYHFDFYRLADPEEFSLAGFREMFGPAAVCLIEWPEKAAGSLPPLDLQIALRVADAGRHASLTAATELGAACLERIATEMARQVA
jgi:tRNA threonylcarbamoyladenosine biosynthesis protein TsaE